ncbi:putative GIY-YIG superfamily endonuclease [Bradyrhizobium japonicum]
MGIYVYMLRCADGSFYIGSATGEDVSRRVDEHNAGAYPGYTYSRRPVVLMWSEYFDRITDGIAAERQLKGWSRAKKEALIRSDWGIGEPACAAAGGGAEVQEVSVSAAADGPRILRGSPRGALRHVSRASG